MERPVDPTRPIIAPLGHRLARGDEDAREVAVAGLHPAAVLDCHVQAVAALPLRRADNPGGGGVDRGAGGRGKVDAAVHPRGAQHRMAPRAELAGQRGRGERQALRMPTTAGRPANLPARVLVVAVTGLGIRAKSIGAPTISSARPNRTPGTVLTEAGASPSGEGSGAVWVMLEVEPSSSSGSAVSASFASARCSRGRHDQARTEKRRKQPAIPVRLRHRDFTGCRKIL